MKNLQNKIIFVLVLMAGWNVLYWSYSTHFNTKHSPPGREGHGLTPIFEISLPTGSSLTLDRGSHRHNGPQLLGVSLSRDVVSSAHDFESHASKLEASLVRYDSGFEPLTSRRDLIGLMNLRVSHWLDSSKHVGDSLKLNGLEKEVNSAEQPEAVSNESETTIDGMLGLFSGVFNYKKDQAKSVTLLFLMIVLGVILSFFVEILKAREGVVNKVNKELFVEMIGSMRSLRFIRAFILSVVILAFVLIPMEMSGFYTFYLPLAFLNGYYWEYTLRVFENVYQEWLPKLATACAKKLYDKVSGDKGETNQNND